MSGFLPLLGGSVLTGADDAWVAFFIAARWRNVYHTLRRCETQPELVDTIIAIKLLHTIVWALIAGCIIALPALAFTRRFGWALILSIVILAECLVLAANKNHCPLTDWAARYTDDPRDNFDIYLPNWLAKHNKLIFGSLFVVNEVVVVWRWLTHP